MLWKKIVIVPEEDNARRVLSGFPEIITIRQAKYLKWQAFQTAGKKKHTKWFLRLVIMLVGKNFTGNTSEKYQLLPLTKRPILDT